MLDRKKIRLFSKVTCTSEHHDERHDATYKAETELAMCNTFKTTTADDELFIIIFDNTILQAILLQ